MGIELSKSHEGRGVIILVHGLNTRPSRFYELRDMFLEARIHVLLVTLSGHNGNDYDSYANVKAEEWVEDVKNAFRLARETFPELAECIWTCGYSLGALVQLVIADEEQYRPQGMLLLAPACTPKWYTHAVRSFRLLPGHWGVKSYSPKGYEAHPKVPFAAYGSLFDLWKQLHAQDLHNRNVPTRVWVDPRDELVSLRGVQRMVGRHRLDRWKVKELVVKREEKKNRFHHIIFNSDSMREDQWLAMTTEMLDFMEMHIKLGEANASY